MNPFELHPTFYNQPIRLSEEEQANPLEVLQDFFFCNQLQDIRPLLWNMVVASLCMPHSVFDEAGQRQSLLSLYHNLERTLEAVRLLCENNCNPNNLRPELLTDKDDYTKLSNLRSSLFA